MLKTIALFEPSFWPNEKRSAYDVVLSEQIVVLDSLTKGLPTMLTIPTEELETIYQEVIQWGK